MVRDIGSEYFISSNFSFINGRYSRLAEDDSVVVRLLRLIGVNLIPEKN